MSTDNTISSVVYQWRTSRGAATQEFTDEEFARGWMEEQLKGAHASFYQTLVLHKITTTVVTDDITNG